MNLQSFRLVQGRLPLVDYLKVSTTYFPLVLCVISRLKYIIHQNFGKLNLWMQIYFIISSLPSKRKGILGLHSVRLSVRPSVCQSAVSVFGTFFLNTCRY